MLDAAEEYILAKNWREKGDKKSARKLVTLFTISCKLQLVIRLWIANERISCG